VLVIEAEERRFWGYKQLHFYFGVQFLWGIAVFGFGKGEL